ATMKKMYEQVIGRQLERQKLIHAAEKKGPSLVEPDDDALETERKMRKKKERKHHKKHHHHHHKRSRHYDDIDNDDDNRSDSGLSDDDDERQGKRRTHRDRKSRRDRHSLWLGHVRGVEGQLVVIIIIGVVPPVQALMVKIALRPARAVDIMRAVHRRRVATKGDRPSRKVLTVDEVSVLDSRLADVVILRPVAEVCGC
ncbi:hypothetical protein FOZ63_009472, partial [Perkinsus olseni]